MNRQLQTGFTLIEIMIAVAILSILAAIAIPAYEGYILESRYGTALKDMRQMQLILDDLALDDDLAAVEPTGYVGATALKVYTVDSGLLVAPSKPAGASEWQDPWGREYRYQSGGGTWCAPDPFCLWSFGPDGADNSGAGDDASPD